MSLSSGRLRLSKGAAGGELSRAVTTEVVPAVFGLLYTLSPLWPSVRAEAESTVAEMGRLSREAGDILQRVRESEGEARAEEQVRAEEVARCRSRLKELKTESTRCSRDENVRVKALDERLQAQVHAIGEGTLGQWIEGPARDVLQRRRIVEGLREETQRCKARMSVLQEEQARLTEQKKGFVELDSRESRLLWDMERLKKGPGLSMTQKVLLWRRRKALREHEEKIARVTSEIEEVTRQKRESQQDRLRRDTEEDRVRGELTEVRVELRRVEDALRGEIPAERSVASEFLEKVVEGGKKGQLLPDKEASELASAIGDVRERIASLEVQVQRKSAGCEEAQRRLKEARAAADSAKLARGQAERRIGWIAEQER